jgi:hypothetical protein
LPLIEYPVDFVFNAATKALTTNRHSEAFDSATAGAAAVFFARTPIQPGEPLPEFVD